MTITQTLILAAPYLFLASALLAALLSLVLFVRARIKQRPFRASIMPLTLGSHFVLSLGTVAAVRQYDFERAKVDTAHCADFAARRAAEGAVATPACDLMSFEFWRHQDGTDLIAYLVMSCALLVIAFHFYRTTLEGVYR